VLFKYFQINGVDPLKYFSENPELINMANQQEVKLCYCENLGIIDKNIGTAVDQSEMKLKLIGAIFVRKNGKMVSQCKSLIDTFSFPVKAIEN
jgi:hypothetical protein